MYRLFDKRLVIGAGLIVSLLVLSAALTYYNTDRLNEDAGWVAHSHEVLGQTSKVLLALLDAEAAEQGYLLTVRDDFLQPFHAALAQLDERLAALKVMTLDNAPQQERFKQLEEMSNEHVALLKEAIDLRGKRGRSVQALLAVINKSRVTMDGIRERIASMQAEEHDLLKDRERRSSRAYYVAVTTGLLTAVVGLALVGAFVWLLARSLSAHQRSQQALQDADRRKNAFLATLAHELRNPLAPIRTAVELLRHVNRHADLMEKARGILERQLGQIIRLVDDLFDISRITRGKVLLRKKRIELSEAVQIALEAAQPHIEASAHQLTVNMPPEPIYLSADPNRLAQIVSNLLNNAARYTEKGGCIWLAVQRQGNEALLSVRDNGVGIAAEHLPHIFEMFAQVGSDSNPPAARGGIGIGLALIRGLVQLHGGSVEAHSDGIGTGSEFLVRLPIIAPEPEA
jgi:signal transduction histidine kinase